MDREENPMQHQDQQPRARALESHQPPQAHKCPRCDSSNTKFCYYNNYSLSQPRYFCKACRRYWTHGGTLRNVPIGGGCRKSKRSRTASSTISSNSLRATTQVLPPPTRPAMPPPPMGNPFYTRSPFFPSFAAMQSLPAEGATVGGGGGQFSPNMSLLQGMSLPSLKPPAPPHPFQPPAAHYFPPQPSFIPAGHFGSWTQGVTNSGGASSSSAATSNLWSCNSDVGAGNDQAGSSFTPNQWSDNNPGFNPSR